MASSSLEAVDEQLTPIDTHRATTEGNSTTTATDSAMQGLATNKKPHSCQDCSVLGGSKMHADTGSSSPVVLCNVDAAYDFGSCSSNAAHG